MAEIYRSASLVLHTMAVKSIGLRTALYGEACVPKKILRKVYLLVVRTQQTRPLLERLLQQVGVLEADALSNLPRAAHDKLPRTTFDSKNRSHLLLLVMAYDLLLGAKGIQGGGTLKRLLLQYHDKLKEMLLKNLKGGQNPCQTGKDAISQDGSSYIPRYLRVNLSKCSREAAIDILKQKLCTSGNSRVANPASLSVVEDPLLPCVLAIPTSMSHCILTRADSEGSVVGQGLVSLQDRASCCAALAAEVVPGLTVLDACAAPGSKTLHILDCLGNCGHLVALERDKKRCSVLIKRLLREANLEGPFLLPTCIQQSRPELLGPSRESLTVVQTPRKATTDLRESEQDFVYLELARLASQRPLFFTQKGLLSTVQHGNAHDPAPNEEGETSGIPPECIPPVPSPASSTYGMPCPPLLVEVRCTDFLQVSGHMKPFSSIETIMLDPSCSGSGLPLHGQWSGTYLNEATGKKAATLRDKYLNSYNDPALSVSPESVYTSGSTDCSGLKVTMRSPQANESGISHANCCDSDQTLPVQSPLVPQLYAGNLPCWLTPEEKQLPSLTVNSASLDRVKKLQKLQQELLVHALTNFPRAYCVCYSTCSLYVEENEGVLSRVGLKPEAPRNTCVASSKGRMRSESVNSNNPKTENTLSTTEVVSKGIISDWFVSRPALHSGWFPPPTVVEHFVKQIQHCLVERKQCGEQTEKTKARKDDSCLVKALRAFCGICVRASPETHACRGFFLSIIRRKPHMDSPNEKGSPTTEVQSQAFHSRKRHLFKNDKHFCDDSRRNPQAMVCSRDSVVSGGRQGKSSKRRIRSWTKAGVSIK